MPTGTDPRKLTFSSTLDVNTLRPSTKVTAADPRAVSMKAHMKPPWRSPAGLANRSSATIVQTVRPGSDLSTHTAPSSRSPFGGTCIRVATA